MAAIALLLLISGLLAYVAADYYRGTTGKSPEVTVGQRTDEPVERTIPLPPVFAPDQGKEL